MFQKFLKIEIAEALDRARAAAKAADEKRPRLAPRPVNREETPQVGCHGEKPMNTMRD